MKQLKKNSVTVSVVLANGTRRQYSWSTPVPFGRALGKGARWAREAMRDEKIPGRSQILQIVVDVWATGRPWLRRKDGDYPGKLKGKTTR